MPPRPGDTVKLDVTTLAYGGQGVARIDEFVIFVRGAIPGDRVPHASRSASTTTPRRGRWRSSPRPRAASAPAAGTPPTAAAASGRRSPTTRSWSTRSSRSWIRCSAWLTSPIRARTDPRHGRPLALPQQDGVLVRRDDGEGLSSACTSAGRGAKSSTSSTVELASERMNRARLAVAAACRDLGLCPTPAAAKGACSVTSSCARALERRPAAQPVRRREIPGEGEVAARVTRRAAARRSR